jgi:DNA-binding NarL/FixJ family response regulator
MSLKVLVVEDNIGDFDLIDTWLQEALGDRMSLDHASSVEGAADLMGRNSYAVIIHDLFLPPWGPESITAAYKNSPETPIIAMSGESSPELHRTAIANGATLFCAKSDLRGDNIVSILAQLVPGIKSP